MIRKYPPPCLETAIYDYLFFSAFTWARHIFHLTWDARQQKLRTRKTVQDGINSAGLNIFNAFGGLIVIIKMKKSKSII